MKKKRTITIEDKVVKSAKIYAQESGRTLSELIEDYLNIITRGNYVEEPQATYQKETDRSKEFIIPEWLKDLASTLNAYIHYVRNRDKIREERYSKYLM
jgi:hypothetical protein